MFEVKSTSGDTFLGGEDFDQRIVDWLVTMFREECGIDLRGDRMALQRLKEAAEKAKCELSHEETAEINLPFISADDSGAAAPAHHADPDKLEELVEDLVEKTRGPCEEALKLAGLSPEDIDEVLLVGGQTRMPKVLEITVRDIFGREPCRDINPDEVVGIGRRDPGRHPQGRRQGPGAARRHAAVAGHRDPRRDVHQDHRTQRHDPDAQSPRSSPPSPTTRPRCRSTSCRASARSRRTTSRWASSSWSASRPPRGATQIEVSFDIDSNGIVSVQARDLATQREQKILVTPSSGLSESEINSIIDDAKKHSEEDRRRGEFIRARARLEGLVESNEKTYNEFGSMLAPDQQSEVRRSWRTPARPWTAAARQNAPRHWRRSPRWVESCPK